MSNFIKAVIKTFRIAIIVLVCTVILLTLTVTVFGIKLYIILDPSMEPEYPIGSLICVKSVDVDSLNAGDVISFRFSSGSVVATHRISETILNPETDERMFVTKGDASDENDPGIVTEDVIVGVPVFVIPKLGDIITYIKYPPGTYITIGISVVMAVFIFFSDNLISLVDKKNKKSVD